MRVLLSILACAAWVAADPAPETVGENVTLPRGTYRLEKPIRVTADGITIDLRAARFVGGTGDASKFSGIGLILEGRRNVTVRGGRFSGFRCAVLVKDCQGVVLEEIDASGNFRQRLSSTPDREASSDWLWPHKNDQQQWRKNYGAGICLENTAGAKVRRCRGRGQQNGLILDRCTGAEVYDNDFSFNSGWGIALWRSSKNVLTHNRCDWCVRGYSHGVYARGQDSAGFLVFEQCSDNVFLKNSATHSGDGFFLYAGNETLKRTGKGGCNGNVVKNNDFSHAVANAIEATFSKGNKFIGNRCDDSNYGVWAGYSYDTVIEGNQFAHNSIAGVAIEHGENNRIVYNTFTGNARGVHLWWDDDKELLASVFGKNHGCDSRGYLIALNSFDGDRVGVQLDRTTGVKILGNDFESVRTVVRATGSALVVRDDDAAPDVPGTKDETEFPGELDAFLPRGHPRGRRHIRVDEWGPLDPLAYAVFPRNASGWGAVSFHVLGPDEIYTVRTDAALRVKKDGRLFRITGGEPGITPFEATVTAGGKTFKVSGHLVNTFWKVRHWNWQADPRKARWQPAGVEFETKSLDFAWGQGGPKGLRPERFATRATTTLTLPAGRYEIVTVSDDGVRVFIDGKKVQDDWTWHAPKENRTVVTLKRGAHEIVVEHFELDGLARLKFDLRPLP